MQHVKDEIKELEDMFIMIAKYEKNKKVDLIKRMKGKLK